MQKKSGNTQIHFQKTPISLKKAEFFANYLFRPKILLIYLINNQN
jgi:hypothetical protein